jgi:hypothetical protein
VRSVAAVSFSRRVGSGLFTQRLDWLPAPIRQRLVSLKGLRAIIFWIRQKDVLSTITCNGHS